MRVWLPTTLSTAAVVEAAVADVVLSEWGEWRG